jgi:hypothetical protein
LNRAHIQGILTELRPLLPSLSAAARQKAADLERAIGSMSKERFEQVTDGAVSKPSGMDQGAAPDLRYLIYEIYTELNEAFTNHRGEGKGNDQFLSVLHRLQAQVDAYDRDFP